MIKMKDFKSMAERRRHEAAKQAAALDQLKDAGAKQELIEAMTGLFDKGLVKVVRGESGDYLFGITETGAEIIDNIDEVSDN